MPKNKGKGCNNRKRGKNEAEDCCATQLIDENGEFNVVGLDSFTRTSSLTDSYAVVAIMGPQSSGKNMLLNHPFHTRFKEMDAYKGSWCHDIGWEHAANKPLLKTVFQFMMCLFRPPKTTLLFVICDKTKTPLEHLEPVLREDIQKIWDAVPKPQTQKNTLLSEFFNVEVTALYSYEEREELFKKQVAQLRQRFFHSISPGGLAGDRQAVLCASGFSFSAQQIWKVIKENRDVDLPARKVMVSTVRCEEIANEKLCRLTSDKGWLALEEAIQAGPLSEDDVEAIYVDENVRSAKRQHLESKALDDKYRAVVLSATPPNEANLTNLTHSDTQPRVSLSPLNAQAWVAVTEGVRKEKLQVVASQAASASTASSGGPMTTSIPETLEQVLRQLRMEVQTQVGSLKTQLQAHSTTMNSVIELLSRQFHGGSSTTNSGQGDPPTVDCVVIITV